MDGALIATRKQTFPTELAHFLSSLIVTFLLPVRFEGFQVRLFHGDISSGGANKCNHVGHCARECLKARVHLNLSEILVSLKRG